MVMLYSMSTIVTGSASRKVRYVEPSSVKSFLRGLSREGSLLHS